MPTNPEGVPGRGDRIAVWLDLHVRHVFLAFVVVTVALVGANVLLATDIEASQEPSAAVFEARDTINERLEPVAHTLPVIVEAPAGDILLPTPLAELAANAAALREADAEGLLAPETIGAQSLLLNRYDREAGATVNGFLTLAEVVEQVVADEFGVDLAAATRDQVKVVVHQVLSEPGTEGLRGQLSEQATATPATVLGREITLYESPALVFTVAGSNAALGGGQFAIGPSADPVVHQKEAFNLNIESGAAR